MHRKNVQKLVDQLKTVKDKKVSMASWFSRNGQGISRKRVPSLDLNNDCRTAACLAGWAVYLFASNEEKEDLANGDGPNIDVLADRYLNLYRYSGPFAQQDPYMDEAVYGCTSMEKVTRKDVIAYLEKRLAHPRE